MPPADRLAEIRAWFQTDTGGGLASRDDVRYLLDLVDRLTIRSCGPGYQADHETPFVGGGSHNFVNIDPTTGTPTHANATEQEAMLGDYPKRNAEYAKDERKRTHIRTTEPL